MPAVEVTKDSSGIKDLGNGHLLVTQAAAPITNKSGLYRGILLRCPGSKDPTPNTRPVWIGRKGVTANSGDTGGMPVVPGSSLFVPIDDPTQLYAVTDTMVDQDLAWLGV